MIGLTRYSQSTAWRAIAIAVLLIACSASLFATQARAATNQAAALLTNPSLAQQYFDSCREKSTGEGLSEVCQHTEGGVQTSCSSLLGGSWSCVFTYGDRSRVEARKNIDGFTSTYTNYDSDGREVGVRDTGTGGDSGTGVGAGDLAGNAFDTAANLFGDVAETLVKPLASFFLKLSSWMLGIVGVFFNWVVIRTVFEFGTYFGTSDGMLVAWGVVRDIANIGLLFGFIFMGVLLILNVDGGGHGHGGGMSAKKAIPRLIIFAVLLNFSLFASQAVIDVSNAFSSQFASLSGMDCKAANTTNECVNIGISGKVLQIAGMSSIWSSDIEADGVVLIGLSIFVLITAVVLLAAGIMLIIRVVILSILMITSPIGFAGLAVPGLQGIAKKWWDTLISQSFFAPVLLLLIFISLRLGEALNPSGTQVASAFEGGNASNAGNIEVLVVFAVVIGMMIASIMVASKIGAMGASFATNTASTVVFGGTARALNLGVGGAARLGRFGIQNMPGDKKAAWRSGVTNLALKPLEGMNLDARRAPGMGKLLGAAGITAGAKPAEHATYGDMAHAVSDIRNAEGSKKRTKEYRDEIDLQALENSAHHNELTEKADMTPEQKGAAEKNRQKLNSLSTKELEVLHGIKDGIAEMAQNLTPEQFEGLMKSDKLDDGQKAKLRDGRLSLLETQVKSGDKSAVRKWATKDLEQLASSPATAHLLRDESFASMLSDDQAEALGKSGKLSATQRTQLETARKGRFSENNARETVSTMSVDTIGKLKGSEVTQRHVLREMTGRQLAAIDSSKLSPEEIENVLQEIRTLGKDNEFFTLLKASPKVQERWGGIV